ncbi:MAG: hypothetical protein JWO36_7197, partial [Myxococcales bacterium]|nr:hypothetical protein [Myxococcales bacterium]
MRQRAGLVALFVVVCIGCKSKPAALAELMKAEGAVDRQEADDKHPWTGAPIGTAFYLGDAVRTADGGARLKLGNSAQIAMQPHTVLRFGRKGAASQISVEVGTIDLSGTGNYGFDVGDVKLAQNGSIRITATGKPGASSIELLAGKVQIATIDGKTVDLEVGKIIELGVGVITMLAAVDAGVEDAAVDAAPPIDAAVDVSGDATLEVVGPGGEQLPPGQSKWAPLAAGAGTIPKGTKIRLGPRTTAKVTANGTTLEIAGGSRVTVGDDLLLFLELGTAHAITTGDSEIKLPGGALAVKGTATSAGEAKLVVDNRADAKITAQRNNAKITGSQGATIDLARGETATLKKGGVITPDSVIPNYFDMAVLVGDTPSFTIHDPKGSTAVQFNFNGKCPNGGIVEMDHDPKFRTAKVSAGKETANMLVPGGSWSYRLRCTQGGNEGAAVASGRIAVIRDDGRRPLPPKPGKNPIDADGRTWSISYQSVIPIVEVKYKGGGSSFKLHLATGGVEETYDSATPVFTVPGTKLKEATYTFWIDHDGVKQDKVSTLKINFDQTAPQVYIESPANGSPFPAEIEVKG